MHKLNNFNPNWNDQESTLNEARTLLDEIANNKIYLNELIDSASQCKELSGMWESHKLLDKLVLYSSQSTGIRLRMHIFKETDIDRPHNHRFPFVARVLKGGYEHTIYGNENSIADALTSNVNIDISKYKPQFRTHHEEGSTYIISENSIHAAETKKGTVTLMLRGAAVLDKSIILDMKKMSVNWKYGKSLEQADIADKYQMSNSRKNEVVAELKDLNVI